MSKQKSIKKKGIQAEQIKNDLGMIAREYIKTPEYQAKLRAQYEPWAIQHRKEFERIAGEVKERLEQSGFTDAMKNLQVQLQGVIESTRPQEITFIPSHPRMAGFDHELVELIAERAAQKTLSRFQKKPSGQKGLVLILTQDGDLYREPRDKYCYAMRGEGKRLAALRALGKAYTPTRAIQDAAGIKSIAAARKAIGTINQKARFRLKLSQDLIESKPYSGYRINPSYRLIAKQ